MATPSPPSTGGGIGGAGHIEFLLTIELSLAQLATLDGAADALVELSGTVTPPTMANAYKVTVSRQPPVIPIV